LIRVKDGLMHCEQNQKMNRHLAYVTRNVPRYTSYPTALQFTGDVDGQTCAAWLQDVAADATVSLYLHVPFCRAICHYCGCHTKAARRDEPIIAYAARLGQEIELVLRHLGAGRRLVHVHWGGGTPSILPEGDFLALVDQIHAGFDCSPEMEHAIELDPRTITPRLAKTLKGAGVNRVSLGMQDFNPEVQLAIGRWQPYEEVVTAVTRLDEAGLDRISFDLMYGLPRQKEREITLNAARAASLWPDRIAVFGYAHVPWLKSHQRRIDTAALPGAVERLEQAKLTGRLLQGAGYEPVGLDHFALPHDNLAMAAARRTLRRNFQGYTSDPADILIGVGASAIGRLPQGYVQNAADIGGWGRAVEAGSLATRRGRRLSVDDVMRGDVIEQLMCFFECDLDMVCARHGLGREALGDCNPALEEMARDGLISLAGGHVHIPPAARPFTRVVAAAFDAYLEPAIDRHSAAV
jgi:oxygen-independent coproporphyrinogen III oxidase